MLCVHIIMTSKHIRVKDKSHDAQSMYCTKLVCTQNPIQNMVLKAVVYNARHH